MTLPLRKKLRTTVQNIRFRAKVLKRQLLRSGLVAGLLLSPTTSLLAQSSSAGNWQPNRLPPAPSMQPLSSQADYTTRPAAAPASQGSAQHASTSAGGDAGVTLRWRTSTRLNNTNTQADSASSATAQHAASRSANSSNFSNMTSAAAANTQAAATRPTHFDAADHQVVAASSTTPSNQAWSANPLRSSGAAQSTSTRQPSTSADRGGSPRPTQYSAPRDAEVRTAAYQPPAGGLLPPAGTFGNDTQLPALPGGLPQLPVDPLGLPEAAPMPPANAAGNAQQALPAMPPAFPAQPESLNVPPATAAEAAPVAPSQSWPGNTPALPPSQRNDLRAQPGEQTEPSRPDPFERRQTLDDLDSPSDRTNANSRESDLGRRRPTEDATVNCETFRDRLRKSTLDKINLNSAPRYGSGLNADMEESEKQRLSFAASAEARDWCDRAGRNLVQGRMVDLINEQVVLDVNGQRREIPLRDLCDVDLAYVGKVWNLPVSCGSGYEPVPGRDFVPSAMQWKASGLCHKPLYFEEVQLERYGHEVGPVLQPFISTAHFFGNVAVLPYKMGIHPPNECQYALGYYRPGDCAPYMIPPIPWSLRGALVEAGAVTGAAALIP